MYPEVTDSTPGVCLKMASVHQKQPAPCVSASAPSGMAGGLAGMVDLGLSVFESSARPVAPSRANKARTAQTVFIMTTIAGCALKANIPFFPFPLRARINRRQQSRHLMDAGPGFNF